MIVIHSTQQVGGTGYKGPRLTNDERVAAWCLRHHPSIQMRVPLLAEVFGITRVAMHVLVSTKTRSKYHHVRDTLDKIGLDAAFKLYVTSAIEERVQAVLDRDTLKRKHGLQSPVAPVEGPNPNAKKHAGKHTLQTKWAGPQTYTIAYLELDDPRNTEDLNRDGVRHAGWFYEDAGNPGYWQSSHLTPTTAKTSTEVYKALVEYAALE